MDNSVDLEALIDYVHERPLIWDKTCEEYKEKRPKFDAWKDICQLLNPNFEVMDGEDQNKFEKLVMKKWMNVKDNWIKCYRKMSKCEKSGETVKKYVYYDRMSFMEKLYDPNFDPNRDVNIKLEYIGEEQEETSTSQNRLNKVIFNLTQSDDLDLAQIPKRRKRAHPESSTNNLLQSEKSTEQPARSSELNEKLIKFMDVVERDINSRSMNFFRGISQTVDSFSEDSLIEFQYQVLTIIKNLQHRDYTQNNHFIAAIN